MKKAVLGALVLLLAVVAFRTMRFSSKQINVAPVRDLPVNANAIANKLAGAIRFQTVSVQDPSTWNPEPFNQFHEYLQQQFPVVHAKLQKEIVADHSLLYMWKGTEPELPAVLLMAHMDVVPAEPGGWKYPPFSGQISDGYVWGRGALDDKGDLISILSAMESLLDAGVSLHRTIYLAFGHDEEVSGKGALAIATLLQSRNVKLDFVLDEGMDIVENIVPGVPKPVAFIGIAEKGYLTVELTAEEPGGHSSTPPEHTAIGKLSEAIERLESHPMPAKIAGTSREVFEYLGPEMALPMRAMLANLWISAPLIKHQLLKDPSLAASLRTTTATTIISGGTKENVLPSKATATVNFRILPGDTIDTVLKHIRDTIQSPDIKITYDRTGATESSSISSTESESFRTVHQTVRQIFPDVIVAPTLVLGATDSRHYAKLTKNIYRFSPTRLSEHDLHRVHGENERESIQNCAGMVRFYIQLIRNCCMNR
jgi:carboxypeptidase PM20D1